MPDSWWTQVRWADATTLTLVPAGELVDVVRGDLQLLRATGDFAASALACLANNDPSSLHSDLALPPAGGGFYYLLRGHLLCNDNHSYSTYSARENPGDPGKRDAEIGSCPP